MSSLPTEAEDIGRDVRDLRIHQRDETLLNLLMAPPAAAIERDIGADVTINKHL